MRDGIQLSEAITGDGAAIFRHACWMDLEGIVSKRTSDPITPAMDEEALAACAVAARKRNVVEHGVNERTSERAIAGRRHLWQVLSNGMQRLLS